VKAVGCVVVVAVVAVGGFCALVVWLMSRGEDQSALTERVQLTVIDPHDVGTGTGSGYRFDYAYERDGHWYGGERFVRNNYWSPGQPITACIDPDHPRQHVITLRQDTCGQKTIVAGLIEKATPTTAPKPRS
jgi:hypothetical protein